MEQLSRNFLFELMNNWWKGNNYHRDQNSILCF